MEHSAPVKTKWALTRESFERLLAQLDSDRDSAGQCYESIRRRLTEFFRMKGCADTDSLVDAVIDRVAKKLEEGEVLRSNPGPYFVSVARYIYFEHLKQDQAVPVEILSPDREPRVMPLVGDIDGEEQFQSEKDLECLERCLARLSHTDRQLIWEYEVGAGRQRIDKRKRLAERLEMLPKGLALRAFRIRKRLRECHEACVTVPGVRR